MTPADTLALAERLENHRVILKSGDYDGADLMRAWCAMSDAAAALRESVAREQAMQARLDRWEPRVNVEVGSYLTGDARCNRLMDGLGKPYPRTCMVCRLGPCRDDVIAYKGLVKAANSLTDNHPLPTPAVEVKP